jgi:hypothetical protein
MEKDPRGDPQWSVFGRKVSKKQNKNFADKNFNSWTCREYVKNTGLSNKTKQNKLYFRLTSCPKSYF